jgi:transcriptional regulator of acetoin/glycerol metabolism
MELRLLRGSHPNRQSSRKLTEDAVRHAIDQAGGNKAKASRILGVGRATLYRFLSDHLNVS